METDLESASSNGAGRSRQTKTAVSVADLEKLYGDGDDVVRAVDGVSFDIAEGTAVGLLGPNGAGKTTIIKSILSLIVPTSGHAEVCGTDVHLDPSTAFGYMGAMLEGARNTYWRLTVRENLEIFTGIAGKDYRKRTDRIDELLEQFSLVEKADTVVRELSRGQKQRVSLACTMARDADVVFLDEPTLGLDIESSLGLRKELRRLVDDEGVTVVLSSHDMSVIHDVCDRVIIMNEGAVVADDTVDNLLGLFETQAYEVVVEEELDSALRDRLVSEFDAKNFDRRNDGTVFEAKVIGDEFYGLIDRLREADRSVVSFNSVEPNLEEVFLHVTDKSGGAEYQFAGTTEVENE